MRKEWGERERERGQPTSCRGQHWYKPPGDTSMQCEESGLCVCVMFTVSKRHHLFRINKCGSESMRCSHQSQAAWTFFPPVETRAFKLQRGREREREADQSAFTKINSFLFQAVFIRRLLSFHTTMNRDQTSPESCKKKNNNNTTSAQ